LKEEVYFQKDILQSLKIQKAVLDKQDDYTSFFDELEREFDQANVQEEDIGFKKQVDHQNTILRKWLPVFSWAATILIIFFIWTRWANSVENQQLADSYFEHYELIDSEWAYIGTTMSFLMIGHSNERIFDPYVFETGFNFTLDWDERHCHLNDWTGLKSMYDNTNNNKWVNKTGWDKLFANQSKPDTCNLYNLRGVGVDTTGRVTNLNLSNNNLDGVIPAELGNLNKLTHLNLSSNSLSGSIPTNLARLNKLTNLDLSSNKLSGKIPSQLGNLRSLQKLNIDSNILDTIIPIEFSNLNELKELNLGILELNHSIEKDSLKNKTFSLEYKGKNEAYKKGKIAYNDGQYLIALLYFRVYLSQKKSSASVELAKGNCEFQLGKIDEAILTFQSILKNTSYWLDNPNRATANWYLALCYLKKDQSEKAKNALNQVSVESDFCEKAEELLKQL